MSYKTIGICMYRYKMVIIIIMPMYRATPNPSWRLYLAVETKYDEHEEKTNRPKWPPWHV